MRQELTLWRQFCSHDHQPLPSPSTIDTTHFHHPTNQQVPIPSTKLSPTTPTITTSISQLTTVKTTEHPYHLVVPPVRTSINSVITIVTTNINYHYPTTILHQQYNQQPSTTTMTISLGQWPTIATTHYHHSPLPTLSHDHQRCDNNFHHHHYTISLRAYLLFEMIFSEPVLWWYSTEWSDGSGFQSRAQPGVKHRAREHLP